MKIEFEVPDWAEGRNITIFAGHELIAMKDYIVKHKDGKHVGKYEPLRIKSEDGRCSGCSDCCKTGFDVPFLKYLVKKLDGFNGSACPFLEENGCGLKDYIFFACARSMCEGKFPNCTEKMV